MKTSELPILLFCAFVLLTCSGKQANQGVDIKSDTQVEETVYPITVPFEKGMEEEREVLLSQIADKVEYIPLETSDQCLIRWLKGGAVLLKNNHWYVYGSKDLYQFTKEGKFVRKFGSVGQGPGQYSNIQHFDIDPENKLIYMLTTSQRINVYSTENGKFQKSIPVPVGTPTQFALLKDSMIASYAYNSTGREKNRIYIMNMKGDSVNAFPRYDSFEVHGGHAYMMVGTEDRYISRYKDMVLLNEVYNDTIYSITKDELLPRYYIHLGKYSIPFDCRYEYLQGNYKLFNDVASSYVRAFTLETDPYLFIRYCYWAGEGSDVNRLTMYNKKDKSCYKVAKDRIKNDWGNGLPVINPATVISDNQLICIYNVEDIFKMAEEDPSILKNEQLKNLKEDDNPVLMVVTLKKTL